MSPDREPSPTSVIPPARKENVLRRNGDLAAISTKTLPAFAGEFVISPRDGAGKEFLGEGVPQGFVRADLASLSTLDRRAQLETGPVENAVKELGSGKAWDIDLAEVMCMNLIASGTFGSVYYGRYQEKEVAVKILNPPSELSDAAMNELTTSFQSEVGVWHGLSHPNIVQVSANFEISAKLNVRWLSIPCISSRKPGSGPGSVYSADASVLSPI